MVTPGSLTIRRLPTAVRRRLEVASAMAWEALVEAHASHALHFLTVVADRLPFEEAVSRYLEEVDARDPLATSVRNRVLAALEHSQIPDAERPHLGLPPALDDEESGWRRFRPDVVMRGLVERQRRHEETEGWVRLAVARAEEGMMATHIDNAITFAAVLHGHVPFERAVEEYVATIGLTGARAQHVLQRTLARLAESQLPPRPGGEPPPPVDSPA